MKELEAELPLREFARVHRKYIVCLDRITAVEADTVQVDTGRALNQQAGPILLPIGSAYSNFSVRVPYLSFGSPSL
jgi:hypothetical protein